MDHQGGWIQGVRQAARGGATFGPDDQAQGGGDLELISDQLWINFGPTFGRLWIDFGPTLDQLWPNFAPTSGRIEGDFGPTLHQLWANFGPTLN